MTQNTVMDMTRSLRGSMNARTGDEVANQVGSQADTVVESGEAIAEVMETGNSILLLSGEHGGVTLTKPHTTLRGVPGAIIGRLVRIEDDAIITGVHFRSSGDETNAKHLVRVKAGAKVVFQDCIFERNSSDESTAPIAPPVTENCFVLIDNGGSAMITGSVFRSQAATGAMSAAAGTVVQNLAPAAGAVHVGWGANLSTQSHGTTVTTSPEIT
jgi:hypothetical protein